MAENVCKMACYEAKTSVLLGINLRTFHVKPPYYWTKKSDVFGFPGGNDAKILLSLILRYLRNEARLGDFRGPSQPVNDWVREPECIRKMSPEKIAHSSDDAIFQAFPEMHNIGLL